MTSDDFKVDTYLSPKQKNLSNTPAGVRIWNDECDVRCHSSLIQGVNRKLAMKAFQELLT